MLPLTAIPPLPPPPPTDCARIPVDEFPVVVINAALSTSTVEALPPLPPAPPRATFALIKLELALALAATVIPPLPPPPPID
jgi:hypothetical protein